MLVTFTCNAYADITMFGDVAVTLLKMMGHSGTVPGAIVAADVPAALDRLKRELEAAKAEPVPDKAAEAADEDRDEPRVNLATRALPLIELLTAAAKADADVMWK